MSSTTIESLPNHIGTLAVLHTIGSSRNLVVKSLQRKIEIAVRQAEIEIRKEHEIDKLVSDIGRDFPTADWGDVSMHAVSHRDLVGWGLGQKLNPKADQQLPSGIETRRKNTEEVLNTALQNRFGQDEDTTVYIICDRILVQHGVFR